MTNEQDSEAQRTTDTKGAAEILGLSTATLSKWRLEGKGPTFYRFGNRVRYQLSDIRSYMNGCRVGGAK